MSNQRIEELEHKLAEREAAYARLDQAYLDCWNDAQDKADALTAAQAEADRLRVDAETVRADAFRECALIAGLHSQYPITTDFDLGYAKARRDASDAIHAAKTEQEREEPITICVPVGCRPAAFRGELGTPSFEVVCHWPDAPSGIYESHEP